jgi:hypothetical protein
VATDRYSRPIGRLSQYTANGACSPLATITFLGEQQDITYPDVAVWTDENRADDSGFIWAAARAQRGQLVTGERRSDDAGADRV